MRWPWGPVALITPFNFPLEIPALQLMGALFMGNKPLVHVDHRCPPAVSAMSPCITLLMVSYPAPGSTHSAFDPHATTFVLQLRGALTMCKKALMHLDGMCLFIIQTPLRLGCLCAKMQSAAIC